MAVLEHITCNSCGEYKQVARNINDYRNICFECEQKETQKKKQEALSKIRFEKSLEERVASLEEKLLLLEEAVRKNSSFRGLHTRIG